MKHFIIMKNQEKNNSSKVFGTVSNAPEMKMTTAGKMRATVRLVSYEKILCEDGTLKNKRVWRNIVAWGKKAEFLCRTFTVGRKVSLDCTYRNGEYTDAQGNAKKIEEYLVNRVLHLGEVKKSVMKTGMDC